MKTEKYDLKNHKHIRSSINLNQVKREVLTKVIYDQSSDRRVEVLYYELGNDDRNNHFKDLIGKKWMLLDVDKGHILDSFQIKKWDIEMIERREGLKVMRLTLST